MNNSEDMTPAQIRYSRINELTDKERLEYNSSAKTDNEDLICQYCEYAIDSSKDPCCDHDWQHEHIAHLSCCREMDPDAYNPHTGELMRRPD